MSHPCYTLLREIRSAAAERRHPGKKEQTMTDIHTWFSLTYSSHLVLDETRTKHLPAQWHADMGAMLNQLERAFPDVNPNGVTYEVLAGEEWECGDLTDEQMAAMDIGTNEQDLHEDCGHEDEDETWECERENLRWYDWRGDEHDRHERVIVPTETAEQASRIERIVVSRTLLQSMPEDWQERFVALLELADDVDAESPECYAIRFYTAQGHRTTDPIPHYQRGRTHIEPRLEVLA
jgi:hypothetical protein